MSHVILLMVLETQLRLMVDQQGSFDGSRSTRASSCLLNSRLSCGVMALIPCHMPFKGLRHRPAHFRQPALCHLSRLPAPVALMWSTAALQHRLSNNNALLEPSSARPLELQGLLQDHHHVLGHPSSSPLHQQASPRSHLIAGLQDGWTAVASGVSTTPGCFSCQRSVCSPSSLCCNPLEVLQAQLLAVPLIEHFHITNAGERVFQAAVAGAAGLVPGQRHLQVPAVGAPGAAAEAAVVQEEACGRC